MYIEVEKHKIKSDISYRQHDMSSEGGIEWIIEGRFKSLLLSYNIFGFVPLKLCSNL